MQRRINVIDMYHGNKVKTTDMQALHDSGIMGIIHKSSQGSHMMDVEFAGRVTAAANAGMLVGAYHFIDGSPVEAQAENFIKCTVARQDIPKISLWADFEDYKSAATLKQLMQFISLVERDDRTPDDLQVGIYSGNRIRETLREPRGGHQDQDMVGVIDFFHRRKLWLAEYGPREIVPFPWNTPIAKTSDESTPLPAPGAFLWQFTETGHVNPLTGSTDGNFFDGTFEELKARRYA